MSQEAAAGSPEIAFLLAAPHVLELEELGQAICTLVTSSCPGSAVAVATEGGSIVAESGFGGADLPLDRQPPDLLASTLGAQVANLGAGLKLLARTGTDCSPTAWLQAAQVAAAGVEHWRLKVGRRVRRNWGRVTRTFTQALMGEIDEEEALELAVQLALGCACADVALLFLPGVGDSWTCEFAAGEGATAHIGDDLVPTPEALRVLSEGRGASYFQPDLALESGAERYGDFGPTCLVPLSIEREPAGALMFLRRKGKLRFSRENLPLAESFAATVSLSLELARGRQAQSVALMLEERDRIGRDLHDLGIQLLFAAGMQLDKLRAEVEEGNYSRRRISEEIRGAMVNLEDAVQQIRQVVSGLKGSEERLSFVDQLEQEASRARRVLGFAPSLMLELDGLALDPHSDSWETQSLEMSSRVKDELSADAIATIRESLANVVKHAGARSVKISASVDGRAPVGELLVSVIDDGRGINLARTRSSGIANMANRASYRGGSFAVGMGPRGSGTSVVWRVPLS